MVHKRKKIESAVRDYVSPLLRPKLTPSLLQMSWIVKLRKGQRVTRQ